MMSKTDNPMRKIAIDKVVINIGVGAAGERLTKATKVIELLTGHKPVITSAKKTIRDFNIRKGLNIGAKVTLRKDDAYKFLKEAFYAKDYKIPVYSFDKQGNAYFGITDYTDFKGMKYDPDIGIFGMDIAIILKRAGGYRLPRRRIAPKSIPRSIGISKEETIQFLEENFNAQIVR
ncbi:50S ribosomal protein L5 [Ferroplasma acidiphilum]|jgi:large subunit ribosomal protein L5|uniref:Large ribosomal subunit protein uL5 n=2 Tax=Ferroplasma TaxID=74968 RepID=S0APC8_FERAC|nr:MULTISPECIES: 50S ribosomal protein L5 [Ferroplasma]MCL4348755.1 50S ribosomal protein L5 [Candidatus Thermoplasmatota archaeon]AGO61128.1 50S ribosomal protein L5P [Ferroplasma acidarmanus Fer1]ARD84102.1 50S ribosomal protein L5P [Ferroplasma acidiphilum]NOL59661.1 50S ribosomal protein L5 [Ferroplasma acidiphilum]WMT53002.1 MAG: 50S ribosomal protein L5 [Ferroplasma acidiphilum]